MIEIELFFKTVESEIRRKHIKYLKKQKCISAAELDLLKNSAHLNEGEISVCESKKCVKSFNKGIETALKVLQSEYKAFIKRCRSEDSL